MAPSYPANVSTVTVNGYWSTSDGSGPAAGTVTFTPNAVLQDGNAVPTGSAWWDDISVHRDVLPSPLPLPY